MENMSSLRKEKKKYYFSEKLSNINFVSKLKLWFMYITFFSIQKNSKERTFFLIYNFT